MALVMQITTTSKKAAAEIKAMATKAGASVRTLEKQSVTSSKRMTASFGKLSGVLGGLGLGLGLIGAVKGFNSVVKAASDTEESLNKVREVFGEAAISVEKFSLTAAESLGASEQAALAMTGEIGNLLVAMKFAEDDAADFSTQMVQLAADLGSFNNVPTADALNAIRSALVGESEPIRRFGADVRQTRLDSIALGLGLEFTKGKMDAQTKALAAMEAIMQDTRKAHGDFRRTSDGLANSQKILGAQFEDLKSVMGERLMPVMKGAVDLLTGFIKAFTESQFDKAIKRLVDLGADVNFVNQLKVQKQINESLQRRIQLAGEIGKFELDTVGASNANLASTREIMRQLAIIKITHDDDLKVLIETAKKTKETEEIQKLLTTVRKEQLEIATALGNHEVGIEKLSASQLLAKKGQLEVLTNITTQAIEFIGLLKEQETIENRIKSLKSEQAGEQDKITKSTQENLTMVGFLGPQIQDIRTGHFEIVEALSEENFHTNLIADATARWKQEAEATKQQLFEAAGILNDIIQLAQGARKFSISGILGLGAGIAGLIPGGQGVAAILGAGSIATRGFQGGGSFTVPGTGSGDRPFAVNLAPGEQVDITPRNQVNNNQKTTVNNTFIFQTADEITIKTKVIPIINDFVTRQGGKLMASGVA